MPPSTFVSKDPSRCSNGNPLLTAQLFCNGPLVGALVLVRALAGVVIGISKQQPAQLRAKIEAELPKRLNTYLPDDVHAVVGFTAAGSLKITCVGGRSPEGLYALERSLEPHVRHAITDLTSEIPGVSVRLSNPRNIRDHDTPTHRI